MIEVVDTLDDAKKMRSTFMARSAGKNRELSWGWPGEMKHVGRCLAVMYTSDKWYDVGDYEDYKHIAEAPQDILFADGFALSFAESRRDAVKLYGRSVELTPPMPRHFAELAPLLGMQVQLYGPGGKKLGRNGDRLLEIEIARGLLGGARHPDSGEAFLVIYKQGAAGVLAIVTGRELDVEKDGIVG
jgi:hypothetical protein